MTRDELKSLIKECIEEYKEDIPSTESYSGALPELNAIVAESNNFDNMISNELVSEAKASLKQRCKLLFDDVFKEVQNFVNKVKTIISNFIDKVKGNTEKIKANIINSELKENRVANRDLTVKCRDYITLMNYLNDMSDFRGICVDCSNKLQSATTTQAPELLSNFNKDFNNKDEEIGNKYKIERGLNHPALMQKVKDTVIKTLTIKKGESVNGYVSEFNNWMKIFDSTQKEVEVESKAIESSLEAVKKTLHKLENKVDNVDDETTITETIKGINVMIGDMAKYYRIQIASISYLYSAMLNHAIFIINNSEKADGKADTTTGSDLKQLAISANSVNN